MNIRQTETFRICESKLRDKRARTVIAARLFRLAQGNAGDVAPVGEGISELRFTIALAIASILSSEARKLLSSYAVATRARKTKTLPQQNNWQWIGVIE